MLQDDQGGHELCDRGGRDRFVGLLLVERLAGLHTVEQGLRGVYFLLQGWGSGECAAGEQPERQDKTAQAADGHGRSPFICFVNIIHDLPV